VFRDEEGKTPYQCGMYFTFTFDINDYGIERLIPLHPIYRELARCRKGMFIEYERVPCVERE